MRREGGREEERKAGGGEEEEKLRLSGSANRVTRRLPIPGTRDQNSLIQSHIIHSQVICLILFLTGHLLVSPLSSRHDKLISRHLARPPSPPVPAFGKKSRVAGRTPRVPSFLVSGTAVNILTGNSCCCGGERGIGVSLQFNLEGGGVDFLLLPDYFVGWKVDDLTNLIKALVCECLLAVVVMAELPHLGRQEAGRRQGLMLAVNQ